LYRKKEKNKERGIERERKKDVERKRERESEKDKRRKAECRTRSCFATFFRPKHWPQAL
jgi:hypothetical protein